MMFLVFLFISLAKATFYDTSRNLIEIPLTGSLTGQRVAELLGLPKPPCDEPEYEYFKEGERMQIWVTSDHEELLKTEEIHHYPGIDESAVSFAEEKARNYMDPTDGAPPDWGQYCGSDCMIARFTALAADGGCKYSTVLEDVGKSVRGRRLIALKIGNVSTAAGPILLGGNIHGNEPIGNQMIQRYAYETCNSPDAAQTKVASSTTVWYYPFFNPDGYESNRRENANGVDLNRNFPVIRTPSAAVETTAYIKFATKIKPSYGTMYHGGMAFAMYPYFDCYNTKVVPRCPPGNVPDSHPRSKDFMTAVNLYGSGMKNGGQSCDTSSCTFNVINNHGYSATGVSSDWAAYKNNQVDITIEVDHTKRPSGSKLPHFYTMHKPIIDKFCLLSV